MKKLVLYTFLAVLPLYANGQALSYKTIDNVYYYDSQTVEPTTYMKEKNLLDIYYPEGNHKIKAEICIADATAAIAWVFRNINRYNGDPKQIFVSGHSAGGYLALMAVMDKSWLQKYNLDSDLVAGLVPFSGHTITHFTIRKEQGIPGEQPIIDRLAPLYHVRENAPPILLITGDREKEMLGRYEENAYFYRMMKVAGHQDITLYEMDGYGHNMTQPAFPLLVDFVKSKSKVE